MPIAVQNAQKKLMCSNHKITKLYCENEVIYSAGNTVTYYIDSSTYYQEEVDSDASCLFPTTFTPSKTGWTFVGWREDTAASGDVLSSKIMGDDPVTLYAVFSKDVILTTVANGSTTERTQQRYYNNGKLENPTFTVFDPSLSGATFKGWSKTYGSTTVSYDTISDTSFSANTTIYAVFKYDDYTASVQTMGGTENYYAVCTVNLSIYTSGTWRVHGIYDNPLGNNSNTLNYERSYNENCNAYDGTDDVTVQIPSNWFTLGTKTLYAYFESGWCEGIVSLIGKITVG